MGDGNEEMSDQMLLPFFRIATFCDVKAKLTSEQMKKSY